jgi:hypothetical protein
MQPLPLRFAPKQRHCCFGKRLSTKGCYDAEKYPDDAPHLMTILAQKEGYTFPYLYDETQEVARAYDAACTPDFYVFDGEMRLAYRGRFDGARPKNDLPVTGADLRAALDAVLNNEPVTERQYPSGGCNIKWKLN